MSSIRRQLLLALIAAMTAVMLLGAWATYRAARDEANEIFDYHLRQLVLSLRDRPYGTVVVPRFGADEEMDFVIQVWDRQGVRLYYSRPHRELPDLAQLGFSTLRTGEGQWRVFAAQMGERTIQVAQPMSVRNTLAANAAYRTLQPFLFLLPGLGLLIWFLVGRALAPLTRLAGAVKARSPELLHPVASDGLPDELQPLAAALNGLLGRLDAALQAQRAFVADAAHELRTPLSALSLQTQLVERARDATERTAAVAELQRGLARATHTVTQLLTLARQEPGGPGRPMTVVLLAELLRRVVAEQVPLARARAIDLGISAADEACTAMGDAEGLRTLLANLIENALRYTPLGGRVDLSVRCGDCGPVIEVSDNGPGIPAAERERVFDRFYRRATDDAAGSGLGLAIVRAIAQAHKARVVLGDARGGGLSVKLMLPPP